MATTIAPPEPRTPAGGGGGAGDRGGEGWGGGGRGPSDADGALAIRRYRTGMWLALGAMTMVFAAFTSAYVVRKGLSNDWRSMRLPSILWLNTAVLAASSLTFERARRDRRGALNWLGVTSALGLIFLIGQYVAWTQLRASGVYVATNPSSSFFYLLTGAHGLHLLGGVAALGYVLLRARLEPAWAGRQAAVEASSLYWHFMDGLWIYLLLLLFLGR